MQLQQNQEGQRSPMLWWGGRYQDIEEASPHIGQGDEPPMPYVHRRNPFLCKPGQA